MAASNLQNISGKNLLKQMKSQQEQKNTDLPSVNINIDLLDEDPMNEQIYNMTGIESLADSIKENGLQQAIRAYKIPSSNRYLIQSGHRRYRACKMINKTMVPVVLVDWEPDENKRLKLLIESNLDNREYTILTKAREIEAYVSTLNNLQKKDALEVVSVKLGISVSTIRRNLTLLKMIPELQKKAEDPDGRYSVAALTEARNMSEEEQFEFNKQIDDYEAEFGSDKLTKEVLTNIAKNIKNPESNSNDKVGIDKKIKVNSFNMKKLNSFTEHFNSSIENITANELNEIKKILLEMMEQIQEKLDEN